MKWCWIPRSYSWKRSVASLLFQKRYIPSCKNGIAKARQILSTPCVILSRRCGVSVPRKWSGKACHAVKGRADARSGNSAPTWQTDFGMIIFNLIERPLPHDGRGRFYLFFDNLIPVSTSNAPSFSIKIDKIRDFHCISFTIPTWYFVPGLIPKHWRKETNTMWDEFWDGLFDALSDLLGR